MTTPIKSSPGDILYAVLVSMGTVKASSGTPFPCYVGNMPDLPDDLVVIYDTSPDIQGRHMSGGQVLSRLGIQIMVRSRLRPDGWTRISTIHKDLTEKISPRLNRRATLKGETWQVSSARITSGPVDLGQEKEGQRRFLFSVNATLAIVFVS